MSVTELKQTIHQRIENIQNQDVLEELLNVIDSKSPEPTLSQEEINIIEERHRRYLSGEDKAIPAAEALAEIKRKYGF